MRRSRPLQFHPSGPGRALRRRLILLLAVFLISAVFFFLLWNRRPAREGQTMPSPTLPVITFDAAGTSVDPLYAYRSEMNPGSLRGALLPLGEDRTVSFTARTFGADINGITYALQTLDGSDTLDRGSVGSFSVSGNILTGQMTLPDVLTENEEYLLQLTLSCSGEELHYYSRISRTVECYESDCLTFARRFHEAALAKDESFVLPYLEEASVQGTDTGTLAQVSVTSPASQVCWGSFDGSRAADPDITFTEINPTYTALEFRYQMLRNAPAGAEYYNVREYFRIRVTPTATYLLDYQRQMTQQAATAGEAADGALPLGVRSASVSMLSNDPGTIAAFVQSGELFEYDLAAGVRRRIFSFSGSTPTDARAANDSHGIRLLSIGENGSLDFVVYGYMNAGEHEGLCGVSLYHYGRAEDLCEERLFLQSSDAWPLLRATLTGAMYVSGDGHFYILLNGALLSVDLRTLETENVVRGLAPGQYAISESGRLFAYVKDGETADTLRILDLETLETSRISAPEGEQLRPAAFYGEDLAYGLVRASDVGVNAAGVSVYPMHQLIILNGIEKSDVRKTYEKDGVFVLSAEAESGGLRLLRAVRNGDYYVETSEDRLQESGAAESSPVALFADSDAVRGTVYFLQLSSAVDAPAMTTAETRKIPFPNAQALILPAPASGDLYLVFVGSEVQLSTTRASSAIRLADQQMGIVIDNAQHLLWARNKPAYRNALGGFVVAAADAESTPDVQCLSALLGRENHPTDVAAALESGKTPLEILREAMPNAAVLDLTGCALTETLYYVGSANPVYAVTGEHNAVLITGYTATNVNLYDPVTDRTRSVPMEEAEAMFSANGNVYLGYVD